MYGRGGGCIQCFPQGELYNALVWPLPLAHRDVLLDRGEALGRLFHQVICICRISSNTLNCTKGGQVSEQEICHYASSSAQVKLRKKGMAHL